MTVFDYRSELCIHLRVDMLVFTKEEVATRSRTDAAFEHLRELHRSVAMQLIEPDDLGPWIYWIHRVETRAELKGYARACGYDAFMADLVAWTQGTDELRLLQRHCPWWSEPESSHLRVEVGRAAHGELPDDEPDPVQVGERTL
ncbi:MAG: hypothetical protein KF894_28715 [Labilithrix sp.]|nr:hypothetical protein [Labilithrix sp.]